MSVTMYAVSGVGNDLFSGSTTGATPIASGTGAATTTSSATVDLSADSPDLSTVASGDTIRLNSRNDGKNTAVVPTDIFEITSVNDGADTITVSPVPDSDTSGVTWAIGGAFATLNRLYKTADPGDTLYAKGIFNESLEMTNITAHASLTNPVRLIGYATTPGDGGMVTLDSNYTKTHGIIPTNNDNYWIFENIRVTRFTGEGWRDASMSTPMICIHCETDHCNGVNGFGVGRYVEFIDCYAHDNAGDGFKTSEQSFYINCVAVANSGNGFWAGGGNVYYGCAAIRNAIAGFWQNADLNHVGYMMFNCLVDGSGITRTGIKIVHDDNSRQPSIFNTIVYGCESGIVCATDLGPFAIGENNLVADCSVPHSNFTQRAGFVSGTPQFVNRNILDYRPTIGSPQDGAGSDLGSSSWLPLS